MPEKMLGEAAGGAGFAPDGRRPQAGAANDGPLITPERTAKVASFIDDPCDEGGYDAFCRDRHGQLCQFHEQYCHAPHYPCIDMLRHALAVSFLEEIADRRSRELKKDVVGK